MSRFNVNDMIDDIVEKQRKKVYNAVLKAEKVAKQRIETLIPEKMAGDKTGQYYDDYSPVGYRRTGQLGGSVGAYTSVTNSKGVVSLQLGVEDESPFGPMSMHHKKGKGKQADEEAIFENFLAGIHPNVYGLHQDFQGTNIEDNINQALDELLAKELMPMIEREAVK